MTILPGEVWIADIRFSNAGGSKKRPVVVLWIDGQDLVVAAVTTAQPRSQYDVILRDWRSAGLRMSSTVRLSRLDCLEQTLMIARLGKLSEVDSEAIKRVWSEHIKPQF